MFDNSRKHEANNNNNKLVQLGTLRKGKQSYLIFILFVCCMYHTCVLCIIITTTKNLNNVVLKDNEK